MSIPKIICITSFCLSAITVWAVFLFDLDKRHLYLAYSLLALAYAMNRKPTTQ